MTGLKEAELSLQETEPTCLSLSPYTALVSEGDVPILTKMKKRYDTS